MTYPDNIVKVIDESVSPNGKLQTSLFQTCKEEEQTEKFIGKKTYDVLMSRYSNNNIPINEYQCNPRIFGLGWYEENAGCFVCSEPKAYSNFHDGTFQLDFGEIVRWNVSKNLVFNPNPHFNYMNEPTFRCPPNTFLTYIQMVIEVTSVWSPYRDDDFRVEDVSTQNCFVTDTFTLSLNGTTADAVTNLILCDDETRHFLSKRPIKSEVQT